LAALAMATIVIGSLIAVRQDNLKRRLAYSTVVHLSYIVLGAALVSPFATIGATLHMVNHGLAKITLFFCAGAIYATTKRENVSQLAGLGHRMPWTFTAFTIGSLGLIGIPGMSGFISKFFLARGAIETGDMVALAVMLGASLLTATYLLPIIRIAFFPGTKALGGRDRGAPRVRRAEARPGLLVPLLVTAVLVVIFGLVPPAFGLQYELAADIAGRVFGGGP
jgi:multicomponent Na+:H+ antiporter subunit D